ncbi:MAG: hypothetical protein LBI11_00640 [Streptococcaceae bacterium]|jgi:lactoylglutathione lyase|nr:hypothetical protein [Streptococcaceae bacterium]
MNICNMLYVGDVEVVAAFWEKVGFVEIGREGEGKALTIIVAPTADSNARLQLWKKSYIEEVSPEVANSVPSLLMTLDDLESMHAKLSEFLAPFDMKSGDFASKIMPISVRDGLTNFAFSDPEGHFYAFAKSEFPDA